MTEEPEVTEETFRDRPSSSRLSRHDEESLDDASRSSAVDFDQSSIEGLPVIFEPNDVMKPAPCAYNDRCLDSPPKELYFAEGLKNSVFPGSPESDLPETACATIDTGCQRMAIGMQTLKSLATHLPDDLHVGLVQQEHRFRSVHGRSTTSHVASLPTSLGPRGSLLRPAVFENPESRTAPFLISLPFLLFCRAVLFLDPQTGLKVHFRKLNVTVPCHIGPTGALRIPLCQFDKNKIKKVQEAQHEFAEHRAEFEILKVQETISDSSTPCSTCEFPSHGARQAKRTRQQRETSRLWRQLIVKMLYLLGPITQLVITLVKGNSRKTEMEMDEASDYDWVSTVASSPTARPYQERSSSSNQVVGLSPLEIPNRPAMSAEVPSPLTPLLTELHGGLRQVPMESPRLRREIAEAPTCMCRQGLPARLFLAQKAGPNFQRLFWRCNKPRQMQCEFFQWLNYQPLWKPPAWDGRQPGKIYDKEPEKIVAACRQVCKHEITSRAGTNAYQEMVRCVACGEILYQVKTKLGEEVAQKKKSSTKSTAKPTKKTEYEQFLEWKASQEKPKGIWKDPEDP